MAYKILPVCLLFSWQPVGLAASFTEPGNTSLPAVASGAVMNWSLGLLIVLAVFMLCVAMLRKLNGSAVNGSEKMRVVGGIGLGMREKVVLLQVGKKQLLLGVTPGRIQTLHVLEGDDCLRNDGSATLLENGFAQKLMQAIKARSDD